MLFRGTIYCGRYVHCSLYHTQQGIYGYRPSHNGHVGQLLKESNPVKRERSIKELSLQEMINAYRRDGHRFAKFNPLKSGPKFVPYVLRGLGLSANEISGDSAAVLNPRFYDLDGAEKVGGLMGDEKSVAEIVHVLHESYCGGIGAEFLHLETEAERNWFARQFESVPASDISRADQLLVAKLMLESQNFDNYLATKFSSVKRYGGEGAESMLAFFYQIFKQSSLESIEQCVIGMPHRGRLNLMVVMLDYAMEHMFQKMKGLPEFPADVDALGDVLSHLSTSVAVDYGEKPLHVSLLPNPSHLEAVTPVAVGHARGRCQTLGLGDYSAADRTSGLPGDGVLCVQVHGDAAFSGQGVIYETLNMSQLPHFNVGGSVHLVVNNQIGYTTQHDRGRSSEYCTDIAKMMGFPVLHVNGDDPEALMKATNLALQYRQLFRKDVFIDLVCFRRWGHNELDDPGFTQPLMYDEIDGRLSVPDLYAEKLINHGVITRDDVTSIISAHSQKVQQRSSEVGSYSHKPNQFGGQWADMKPAPNNIEKWKTGLDSSLLKFIGAKSVEVPSDFTPHAHLAKMHIAARLKRLELANSIDWSTAEALAFGSLLVQGTNIRLCGQDVGRGTFSQRHAMLVDNKSDRAIIPLNDIALDQTGKLEICNSFLSEEAVMGFEYGMSIENPDRLVIWEAQFGDFFNGAQIILDTFITCGETKWLKHCGMVLLLPHGYDGAGPEHSSCRIERFLQMTDSSETKIDGANVNFEFVHPTTSAQYFHLLRRQMVRAHRKPLIVASPKILLRLSAASSALREFEVSVCFEPVLPDPVVSAERVTKVVLCSGKHYYALDRYRSDKKLENVGIVRLESLCPFPTQELQNVLKTFKNALEFVWSQEEPRNQGPWSFVRPRFENLVGISPKYAGRDVLPIPAVAIGKMHHEQCDDILKDTFS